MRRIHATFNPTSLDSVARILARRGTWSDPTLVQLRGFYLPPDTSPAAAVLLRYVPPPVRHQWAARIGARSTADESMAVRRTAYAATDSLGTIAPGQLADLVLLDADPLADISNTRRIRAVMAGGRLFDRSALDAFLAGAERAAAAHVSSPP